MATLCFQERFLYGLAVLEVDMRKHGRSARRTPKPSVAEAVGSIGFKLQNARSRTC